MSLAVSRREELSGRRGSGRGRAARCPRRRMGRPLEDEAAAAAEFTCARLRPRGRSQAHEIPRKLLGQALGPWHPGAFSRQLTGRPRYPDGVPRRTRIGGLLALDGVQYGCGLDTARLEANGIQPSTRRIACPWDNARAEIVMKTSKHQAADGRTFRTTAEAGSAIGSFIDEVCYSRRLHSAVHYQMPSDP